MVIFLDPGSLFLRLYLLRLLSHVAELLVVAIHLAHEFVILQKRVMHLSAVLHFEVYYC